MNTYQRHRFPPEIIAYAVCFYLLNAFLQVKRGAAAAKRFFKRLLRSHGAESRKIVMDKFRSYPVDNRKVIPEAMHITGQYANNQAEQSQEATRARTQRITCWFRA